jgi:hypothetical protein
MTAPVNYPSLGSLISPSALPASLGFVTTAAQQLLEGLRYSALVIESSPENDARFYGVTLVEKELAIDLLGSGVRLIFFPADPNNTNQAVSEIPLTFSYRWPVQRYLPAFETLSFAHGGRAFLDLLLNLLELSQEQFLDGLIDAMIDDPEPEEAFFGRIAAWQGGGSPLGAPTLADVPPQFSPVQYIVAQSQSGGLELAELVFAIAIDDPDPEQAIDNVVKLARRWLGGIDRSDLERLLVPQFALELTSVKLAVEVPQSALQRIKADGTPDTVNNWRATFTAGGLGYDSSKGFHIGIDESLAIDLPPALIPGLGITVQLRDVKLDLSRDSNIAEANADGRGADFMGLYARTASISLPHEWFEAVSPSGATLGIVARNLIVGTGYGLSGTVGIEVLGPGDIPKEDEEPSDGTEELKFILGKAPQSGARKGFAIGFSRFQMIFRQNVLLSTSITGSLTVPRLTTGKIGIELMFDRDGDFAITATLPGNGHDFELPNIFVYTAQIISVGKENGRVFLQTTGDLSFVNNAILGSLIPGPIHISKLTIDSAGGMSIEGGSIPLPESVVLPLGPVKLAITAIHIGKATENHGGEPRRYGMFGLDATLDSNPTGVKAKGDGVCFYYTTDDDEHGGNSHRFIRINKFKINIVLPMGASNEDAVLIMCGFLARKGSLFQGSISFIMPQVSLAGGIAMQYDTEYPAWLVQGWLELPMGIPFGSTGMCIYGFDGTFGFNFGANKLAVAGLTEESSWIEYYDGAPRGLDYLKFLPPDQMEGASNPFVIGAGVSLATQLNEGKTLTTKLFLMLQIPFMLFLEGRFDVMADQRLGLSDEEAPFYVILVISKESIELGAGAHYLLPRESGDVLKLDAVMEAAFFFHNASAWYVNVGTEEKPVTAEVIGMFHTHSFLMLSKSGVQAGAGITYDFHKHYGPISVDAHAYLDLWGHVSFIRGAAGGGVALGGYLDVRAFKIGLRISLATALTVEVPKPFRVAGSVEVCVSVNLVVKKFEKCVDVDFVWERSTDIDLEGVPILDGGSEGAPASAVHMVSGATYPLEFSTSGEPAEQRYVPIDSFIDIKLAKPVAPGPGTGNIGGYTSPASGATERLPPRYAARAVDHQYSLESIALQVRKPDESWTDYNPYAALAGEATIGTVADPAALPIGMWQKQEQGYANIRLLALTPFSFMRPGISYRPEEWGVTPAATYCVGAARSEHCAIMDGYVVYSAGTGSEINGMIFRVEAQPASMVGLDDPRLAPRSLALRPGARLVLTFQEPVASCRIVAHSQAPQLVFRFQRRKGITLDTNPVPITIPWPNATPEYEDQEVRTVSRANLAQDVVYDDPQAPIERVLIETPVPDAALIARLENELETLYDQWLVADVRARRAIDARSEEVRKALAAEHARTCIDRPWGRSADADPQLAELRERLATKKHAHDDARARYDRSCGPGAAQPNSKQDREQPGSSSAIAEQARGCLGFLFPRQQNSELARGCLAFLFPPPKPEVDCAALARDIEALENEIRSLEAAIEQLEQSGYHAPEGWECGTFVHELCWMTAQDLAYNQSIPGIAAIEADYSMMREAMSEVIAPALRPHEIYRVKMEVRDRLTPAGGATIDRDTTCYVHFRTDGPLGHYSQYVPPTLPAVADAGSIPDDGRDEAPELSLRYYLDGRSFPNADGSLELEKPLYWLDASLTLFFIYPHAYHFFADWPDDLGLGPRHYAMEIRVVDPAMATIDPLAPAHEAPDIETPTIGPISWVEDVAPRIAPEVDLINAFREPLPHPDSGETICLTIGGDPIQPASRALHTDLGDLRPSTLYTAIVFNRRLDGIPSEAKVYNYTFCTSLFATFGDHIGSCVLRDRHGNSRMAVYSIDHALAAGARAVALATVQGSSTDNADAYPDPFDRLIYAQLALPVPEPSRGLEFNFITDTASGETYGLWIRSIEAINPPRIDRAQAAAAVVLEANGVPVDVETLVSKDGRELFLMAASGALPIADLTLAFTYFAWDGHNYAEVEMVRTDAFAKP